MEWTKSVMSLGLILLSGQQAKQPEKPKPDDWPVITGVTMWTPPEPEAKMDDPIRKDGRIISTLSLKDDWSCAPMSNWTPHGYDEGTVTAIQLICVKTAAPPVAKKESH